MTDATLAIEAKDGAVRFAVLVAPRASRESVLGVHDGSLKIALTAPPVDGAANAALVAFLARALGVGKRDVRITAGESSRRKRVEIRGTSVEAVRALV
ncbi:MAG: DUF167 family protein [Sandaracinus sp.]